MGWNPTKVFKDAAKAVSKTVKSVTKGVGKGIHSVGKGLGSFYDSEIGRALTYAAIAAASVYTGGAAAGLSGTALAVGTTGAGLTGAQMGQASAATEIAERKEAAAQYDAEQKSIAAERESEILRKQALLTSQMSISQRQNQATAIANRLKNTNTAFMGGEEEKLGG